jgi:hypothetical protein
VYRRRPDETLLLSRPLPLPRDSEFLSVRWTANLRIANQLKIVHLDLPTVLDLALHERRHTQTIELR